MVSRHWDHELKRWIYDKDVHKALDAAALAISEYHNGDRLWAERWLITAIEANKK